MGYMRHHAIIVTGSDYPAALASIEEAHLRAMGLFGPRCTPLVQTSINGYLSFFIAPDGSKEGWPDSAKGDENRAELITWMDTQRYQDGSSVLYWAEVQYGDDAKETKIVSHSDEVERCLPGVLP